MIDSSLILFKSPGWRNGRLKGLKIPRLKSHRGSTPLPGTSFLSWEIKKMIKIFLLLFLITGEYDECSPGFNDYYLCLHDTRRGCIEKCELKYRNEKKVEKCVRRCDREYNKKLKTNP